jgi:hypothetical protein
MDAQAVPQQSQQQGRQEDDLQAKDAVEQVTGKRPGAFFDGADSARAHEKPAEHEEDDDRRMAEFSQEVHSCGHRGMDRGLRPIQQEHGTQVLEGDCSRSESSSEVEVSGGSFAQSSSRRDCRQLCGGAQSLTPSVPAPLILIKLVE